MSKKEKVFPIHTLGGRIQAIRQEKGLNKIEFYNMLFPNRDYLSNDSKSRTVFNWESNSNAPDYETLCRICDTFECDADYLLGRITQKTHDMEIACQTTGLSEKAISILQQPATKTAFDPFLKSRLPVFTYANELEEILEDYPEILHDINTVLTHEKKSKKLDASMYCLQLAYKIYSYTQSHKKRFSVPNMEIYNFALAFIQQKLSYLESAATHFAKKSGEEGASFTAGLSLNQHYSD